MNGTSRVEQKFTTMTSLRCGYPFGRTRTDISPISDEKNDRGNEHEIDVDEIFAGHLDFIISEIGK